jgi:hypothetical protein
MSCTKRIARKFIVRARMAGTVVLVLVASNMGAQAAGPFPAPEIDPGSILGGVTVFACGLLILIDRRRRA